MAQLAERQQLHTTAFVQPAGGRAALARPYPQTAPKPSPAPDKSREAQKARREANRIAALYSGALAGALAMVGAVFLYGHVQLAREAQRSVVVSQMLSQQVERSRLLANSEARNVTPTSIAQKAIQAGMMHPEEKDAIVVP